MVSIKANIIYITIIESTDVEIKSNFIIIYVPLNKVAAQYKISNAMFLYNIMYQFYKNRSKSIVKL